MPIQVVIRKTHYSTLPCSAVLSRLANAIVREKSGLHKYINIIGYNLFAKAAVLPKGYYFCAKGEAEGG